jgi:proline iminopeptidase
LDVTLDAEVRHIEVPGARLWTATEGKGVPLVLCHGGPGGYDSLEPVVAMVDDLARVHRFDQRGGGRSTLDGPWTVATFVADMEALRRHWQHDRWVVAGHSWGAHLAMFYALAHPRQTHALALLNTPGIRWGWGAERRANRLPRLTAREHAEVESLEARLTRCEDDAARSRLRDLMWLTDFADRGNAVRSFRSHEYPPNAAIVESVERDWERALDGIEHDIAKLTVPTLVLHGEADPIPEWGPCELAELLPQGRFVVLPAVGHVPWSEPGDDLRRHLRDFLCQVGN